MQSDEEVLKAAGREFTKHAYAAAALSSIAAHLGLTKGALVRRFPTKAHFAAGVLASTHNAIAEERKLSLEAYPDSGIRALLRFFLAIGVRIHRDRRVSGAFVLITDRGSPIFASPEFYETWTGTLKTFLTLAQEAGEIDASEDIQDLTEYLFYVSMGEGIFGNRFRVAQPSAPRMRMLRRALMHLVDQEDGDIINEVIDSRGNGTLQFIAPRTGVSINLNE